MKCKDSSVGFLRGFPVIGDKKSNIFSRCIEIFYNYTDIYGSSYVYSLDSLKSLYVLPEKQSVLEALKHDVEIDRNLKQFQIHIESKSNKKDYPRLTMSFEILDLMINTASNEPKIKVFDGNIENLSKTIVTDSPTGVMIIRG